MRLPNIAVQRFQIEGELAHIFRLKSPHLEFYGNEAIKAAVKELLGPV
jgi:hypothetical protein